MPGSRPEEPEVIDLGLLEPVDAPDVPDVSATQRDDGRTEEPPPPHTLPERWRRARTAVTAAWHSPSRAALVVAAVVGLLVGAVGYGAVDRQQELATARANPDLVAQVVPNNIGGASGAFNIAVSVANTSEQDVTVRGLVLDSDPDFGREGISREVGARSQATMLIGAELGCEEPIPPLDRLRLDITTADQLRRTLVVPLLVGDSMRAELEGQRSFACGVDQQQPTVYAISMVRGGSPDPDEVVIRFDLQVQSGDDAELTGLVPVTSAFAVTTEGLPRALERGPERVRVETVWRVADCARAALATAFDTTLAPVVDGVQQQELIQVYEEPFADLIRLGARVCAGS